MPETPIKVLFAFHSDLLEKWTIKTMWANVVDADNDLYQLDSIPFYATGVAWGDIVRAPYSQERERPQFLEVVQPSGHSTVQVVVLKGQDKEGLRQRFSDIGCDSEGMKESYFVLDVPASIAYPIVQSLLNELQSAGIIDYAECCLSAVHYYE